MTEELRICGRPTRSGAPCQVKLTASETVCGMHAESQTSGDTIVYELGGDQVVAVGRYAYRWRGAPPLAVGERVLLPENWLSRKKDGPGDWVGVVTELGTAYTGNLAFVVDRAPTEPDNRVTMN